jgi:hypothetical protein
LVERFETHHYAHRIASRQGPPRRASRAIAPAAALPGDDLVPAASIAFDRGRVIDARPREIWPWLVQLGKRRAGWYLPRTAERLIPRGRRAARAIDPTWQALAAGDRIPDYGGRDAELEVVVIEAPTALVYRSQRHRAEFSWALVLEDLEDGGTLVRLRFRGRLESRGWRRSVIVAVGGLFDRITSELMLAGLAERVE